MNHGLALIAAVLESKDIAEAIRLGAATPNIFNEETQIYWDALSGHYESFHEVPSTDYFTSTYCPDYTHVKVQDSFEALIHELKTQKLGREIEDGLINVAEMNAADPWEAKQVLSQITDTVISANQEGNTDYVVGSDVEQFMKRLERVQNHGGMLGIPFPWNFFNVRSGGMSPGYCIYLYGRQKSKKTWIALYWALFYASRNIKVLFFARDTPVDELKVRIVALMCGLEPTKVKQGNLSDAEKQAVTDCMELLAEEGKFIITDAADGVAGFKARIEEHKPQVVFHDYFKAMADDIMGDKVTNEHKYVARTVDQMVRYCKDKMKIPLIFVGHANRDGDKSKGKGSSEQAWSDHITRMVDVSLRVVKGPSQVALIVNAARDMDEGTGISIDGSMCYGFGRELSSDYSWINTIDVADAEEQRQRPQGPSGKKTKFESKAFTPPVRRRKKA
jgi:hypothetical protein